MEQAQKLLKAQQLAALKDPFPQGHNSTLASNVVGAPQMLLNPIISTWFDPRLYYRPGTRTMKKRPRRRVSR